MTKNFHEDPISFIRQIAGRGHILQCWRILQKFLYPDPDAMTSKIWQVSSSTDILKVSKRSD